MIDTVLSLIAPHYCCGCDRVGSLLCDNCKYNITSEIKTVCLVCKRQTSDNGVCSTCRTNYDRAWSVGERTGALQRVIDLYKFERARAAHKTLGDLLLEVLPILPDNTVIVPIPTVTSHTRQRGYNHSLLIARYVARTRGHVLDRALLRKSDFKQRGASATARRRQAKEAFKVKQIIDPGAVYLLVDDIVTTGATLDYAAKALKEAGAHVVWVAVVAYQTLD